ncbi:peptidase M61 [Sphingomonas sp. MAH-20]|uniref:Peptidase M61 n=1 Tax=Sphingomonas horti TaxID=2682842 RepID=A0A6I4J7Y5_9SPHN|nr:MULTISPECIES: peptidase M61 [Sphingomonas]MBA2918908.1 M61 family metallopeptidase [Sphingomonas sp. CGMCC 1.13658]MVO78941.1 peptidase M61 [Sphingomonas horti]
MIIRSLLLATSLVAAAPLLAENSRPEAIPAIAQVPQSKDEPYPGTIRLDVDATDVARGIFRVKESIPVDKPGPMTLLFPKWLQGNHAPRGEIDKLADLVVTANGKTVPWRRDPYDVYAFHIDVPQGAKTVELSFQFLSATAPSQGRIVATPAMLNLQWNSVSLYPAGYYARQIPIQATARYPEGWRAFSGLPSDVAGGVYRYEKTSYETLLDSPVFAGKYARQEQLTPDVRLNIVADEPADLAATPEQIETHRRLVEQAVKLFGAQHYDKYEFLLALTDEMGGIGLEHHRSSENGANPEYFTKWNDGPGRRNLLAHEFTHSWNGKFRRPAGLWTPDHNTPTKNSLLWVYEGQTQFWGYVLGARSGLFTKQETLDALASIAATLDQRPAREWRGLEDTTYDPIISARRPKGWVSWQRSEDYYNEGMLVWLEVDATLRRLTDGRRGMDDFARAFFGIGDRDWGVVTYTLDDIVRTLNGIAPYDWAGLLDKRLFEHAEGAPLTGFTASGYKLVYTAEPTPFFKDAEKRSKGTDLSFSGGFSVDKDRKISSVIWDSPAYKAGLTVGTEIAAVNGKPYSAEVIKDAITAAASAKEPIQLLVRNFDQYRTLPLDWHGGLRYPRLEKFGTGEGALDRLLTPR